MFSFTATGTVPPRPDSRRRTLFGSCLPTRTRRLASYVSLSYLVLDEVDEEEGWAARLDVWIVWRGARCSHSISILLFSFVPNSCSGEPYPVLRNAEAEYLLTFARCGETPRISSYPYVSAYVVRRGEGRETRHKSKLNLYLDMHCTIYAHLSRHDNAAMVTMVDQLCSYLQRH